MKIKKATKKQMQEYTEFMPFIKIENVFLSIIGSIIGLALWLLNPNFFGMTLLADINFIYVTVFLGTLFLYLATAAMIHMAVDSPKHAAQLALRRGWFTFTVMFWVIIIGLSITQKIAWDQQFFYAVKYFFTAIVVITPVTILFDPGILFIKQHFKQKEKKGKKKSR